MNARFAIIILILIFLPIFAMMGQNIRVENHVSMLALGDSYTIGESVLKEERWPHQFAEALREQGLEVDEPDYIATTGWTTTRLIQGMRTLADKEKTYNLVSILIGVNNQYQGLPFESYEPDLRTIIDKALAIVEQDTARVFILSIPDYAYTPYGRGDEKISADIDRYNQLKFEVAAEYGIAYINITPISRLGLNRTELVAKDGLHPSAIQYGMWVESVIPRVSYDITLHSEGQILPEKDPRIYPNPVRDLLFLESFRPGCQATVFNLLGEKMLQEEVKSELHPLDVSGLSIGAYSLRVSCSGEEGRPFNSLFLISSSTP